MRNLRFSIPPRSANCQRRWSRGYSVKHHDGSRSTTGQHDATGQLRLPAAPNPAEDEHAEAVFAAAADDADEEGQSGAVAVHGTTAAARTATAAYDSFAAVPATDELPTATDDAGTSKRSGRK